MKKKLVLASLTAAMMLAAGGTALAAEGSYSTIVEVEDWGATITKVIVDLGQEVSGEIDTDTFSVDVARSDSRLETPLLEKGNRRVTSAYISDADGNAAEAGQYATLELAYGPNISLGSALNYADGRNVWIDCDYTITQEKDIVTDTVTVSGIVATELSQSRRLEIEDFTISTGTFGDVEYAYADYKPESDGEKHPLIIWLHGAGEGGQEPPIAAIGNKVVNLISPKVQKIFGGKTYLLAPQAPTMWMDDGTGEYTKDGSSKYTEVLDALIGAFVDAHPQIDRSRIYIGGCSNGGFMTMKQIIFNPSRYAAAYPVCEALADAFISDEDILKLKDLPIWFTHAKTDPVVVPDDFVVPTYERLAKVNPNAHFTYWDKVLDHTGTQKNADGTPFEYIGHWSWIPMLNDECVLDYDGKPVITDGKETPILEWMAAQKKA